MRAREKTRYAAPVESALGPTEAEKGYAELEQEEPAAELPATSEGLTFAPAGVNWDAIIKASLAQRARKIIYRGYLTLESAKIGKTVDNVKQVASELGGYVESAEYDRQGERVTASITVRVPQENFHRAMNALQNLGRVVGRREEAEEVTGEFRDLRARLATLELTEQRLLSLLDRAGTLTAALKVENELTRVRGEIERLRSYLDYLRDQVAMSTIAVSIVQPRAEVALAAAGAQAARWRPRKILAHALASLLLTLQVIATVAIWLVTFTPIWLPVALIVLLARRRLAGAATKTGGE